MHQEIVFFLSLLFIANGAPILTSWILSNRWNFPVDAHILFFDHKPLFGPTKTLRGLFASLFFTVAFAMIFNYTWSIGLLIFIGAMSGDLLSSFLKRRLGLKSSSMSLGLDQIPESLIPAIACKAILKFSWMDILWITILFFVFELILSRILFIFKIRKHPY